MGGVMSVVRNAGRSRNENHPWAQGVTSPFFLAVAFLAFAACGPLNTLPALATGPAQSPEAASSALSTKSRVIRVPEDQPTIAAAMAAAQPGDTVKLAAGTYKETLVLKNGVRVVGGPSTLDATGLDNGIVGDASVTSGASVEGLTVQNSTYQGVYIGGSKGVRLSNCIIRASGIESQSAGLRSDAAQLSIENSEISGSGGAGIRVITSDLNLKGSRIFGNAGAGLRAEESKAAVTNNVMERNAGAGTRITHGSTATVLGNQLSGNSLGVRIDAGDDPADYRASSARVENNVMTGNVAYGVFVDQGSSANLERNEITGSPDTGVLVSGGYDPGNQQRCSVHLDQNNIIGNGTGLQIFNSDATSEGDRFEQNGIGILAAFGASVAASDGSVLGSGAQGVFARDALEYFFCGNDDCTVTQLAVATVHVSLERMRVENSGASGVTAWGSMVKVSDSSLRGNVDGVFAFSGSDYQLGDGVIHHLETPGTVNVEGSQLEGNSNNGAFEYGISALKVARSSLRSNGVGFRVHNGGTGVLESSEVMGNVYDGVDLADGSTGRLEHNVISDNQGDGIIVIHGSTAHLESNQVNGNSATGIDVLGGWNAVDQSRSSAVLERNVVTSNFLGIQVQNSDLVSVGDRVDQNGNYGVTVAFGAHLDASGGSVSGNQYGGIWARDMTFFCANPDCSLQEIGVATVRLSLDRMQISDNRFNGCAATGGQVVVRGSNFSGNGGNGGVLALSGWDYDLGDGVGRHVEMPGLVTVRSSSFTGNTPWAAIVKGQSTLDLGTGSGGGNSVVGNGGRGVVNETSPLATVSAEGNWWGTTDPGAIAAMMSGGPVDFIPFLTSPPR